MEAKDLVMAVTDREIVDVINNPRRSLEDQLLMQAEIALKAGRREVVEWIEKNFGYFIDEGLAKIIIDDGGYFGCEGSVAKWQSKLKEWGIKQESGQR